MPGDSSPGGAEELPLGASLALLPELVCTAAIPSASKASLGGGCSALVYQVTREDLRPPLEQQRVALPAPAGRQATAIQP